MSVPLKPQDLIVCLDLATRDSTPWTYAELGVDLGMSASEANQAVGRATRAGLLGPSPDAEGKPAPRVSALVEFLEHGVRYAFFAQPGKIVRGMPTAHSAPPLANRIQASDEPPFVWPDPEGAVRGQAVEPLYSTVPQVARRSPELYELLALVDALRCGRPRERKMAADELRKRLADARER